MKVGCCGWGYLIPRNFGIENWKKKFKSKLACYASLFDLVEVNSTFYKLPKVETAERWLEEAREVNKKFEFTVKAHQETSHGDQFKGKRSIEAFNATKEIARALDARIILIQTPASFKDTPANVERVRKFFSRIDQESFTIVVELRGFGDESISKLCEEFSLIHCVDPFARKPVTKGFYYFRLHGKPPGSRMYYYKYTESDLKKLLKLPKRSYVLFNNIYMYDDAMRFKRMLK